MIKQEVFDEWWASVTAEPARDRSPAMAQTAPPRWPASDLAIERDERPGDRSSFGDRIWDEW